MFETETIIICRLCGQGIYEIQLESGAVSWTTGPLAEFAGSWKLLDPAEPWFTTCPGSKEALVKYPTYTDYFNASVTNGLVGITRHIPLLGLERLIHEVMCDEL